MRDEGFSRVIRGRSYRIMIPTKDRKCANYLLDRDFNASCIDLGTNRAGIAHFMYCRVRCGFASVSFIIALFSRKIVAWHVMATGPTKLVSVPVRMALWNLRHEGIEIFEGSLHKTNTGAQYVSRKFLSRTHA